VFCSGETKFPFRGRFALPPHWCLLGYIHDTPSGSWCHGTSLGAGAAFTVLPERTTEFMLCAGSRISAMLVPMDMLQRKFMQLETGHADMPTRQLSLFTMSNEQQARNLRIQFEHICERSIRNHFIADAPAVYAEDIAALVETHLLAALSTRPEDHPHSSRGQRAHYLIIQRVEQFIRANMRRDIYLNEMCNAAGVSERAMRYAFEDLLGLSPNRYLFNLRLCAACRSLSMSDASKRSVKSVALSCGLWDLSRFADHYRRMFGELPRDTLMRSPPGDSIAS
jgi:AraC family ethanolamine operon transcriptional activator